MNKNHNNISVVTKITLGCDAVKCSLARQHTKVWTGLLIRASVFISLYCVYYSPSYDGDDLCVRIMRLNTVNLDLLSAHISKFHFWPSQNRFEEINHSKNQLSI